jgi:hypothetical protein
MPVVWSAVRAFFTNPNLWRNVGISALFYFGGNATSDVIDSTAELVDEITEPVTNVLDSDEDSRKRNSQFIVAGIIFMFLNHFLKSK